MNDELEPCPLCGGEGRINTRTFSDADADVGNSYIECIECGVETPWRLTESEAIAAWNRRATPEPDSDLVEIGAKAAALEAGATWPQDANRYRKIARAVIAAVTPQIAAAARENERAAVVAWLRREMIDEFGKCAEQQAVWWFANAIERGEHRENGDG